MDPERILVVEDELIVAEDIKATLEAKGYAVPDTAASPAEAERLAAAGRPDLVLMDIVLGEEEGIGAAQRIRSELAIPVVFLTAYSDAAMVERAAAAEPYGYLVKPFQERELYAAIEIALYKHRMEARVGQLNGMLRAISEVNQLIVREPDPAALIQQACELLVAAGSCTAAWLAAGTPGEPPLAVAEAGHGAHFAGLRAELEQGRWPPCLDDALAAEDRIALCRAAARQAACPLAAHHAGTPAVAVALREGDTCTGVLGLCVPANAVIGKQERQLFAEVADDIAFALAKIRADRLRAEAERETAALLAASRAVLDSPSFAAVGPKLLEICRRLTGAAAGTILLERESIEDPQGGPGGDRAARLAAALRAGPLQLQTLGAEPPDGAGPNTDRAAVSGVAATGRADAAVDDLLVAPIQLAGQLEGLIALADKPGGFDRDDLRRTEGVSELAALALERQRFVEQVLERDELLQATGRMARVGGWELDARTRQVTWSAVTREIHEMDAEHEPPLDDAIDFFHPDDRPKLQAAIEAALEHGEPYDLELRFVTAKGRPLWTHTLCRPVLKDGRVVKLYGTFQDVTERKQAEEQARLATRRLRETVRAGNVGLWDWDLRTGEVDFSPEWKRQIGYEDHEIGSDFEEWRSRVHPDDLAATVAAVERNIAEKRQDGQVEFRFRHRDGSYRWILTQSSVHTDEEGNPVRMLGSHVDITERKRAEQERRALEEQLGQAQRMESIGRLAGGIAHDFNNLLTVINSYARMAAEDLRDGDPLKADLEQILDAGVRAATLTQQLLAFSRKQVLEPVPLSLNDVVTELEPMAGRLIGEDIALRIDLAEDLGTASADPTQLEQVLLNLLVNARDAMPEGGTIVIETRNVEIDEAYAAAHRDAVAGPHVMLSVTDTGSGMTPEVREHIFEPFFTTKETGKGTGLGLAMVHGIVKQSGGNIWVYAEPGKGTCFKIHLPRLAHEEAQPRRATDVQPEKARGSETILVVEDDDRVRQLVERVLRSAGYRVLLATDGRQALTACERADQEIALLLTDVVMPTMGGKELADRLVELRPSVKVLYMSGYTENAIVHRGVLDEGTRLLSKPFDAQQLLRSVRLALDETAS